MPRNPSQKILEIGMGGGDTLVEIKRQQLAGETVGIDLMELAGTNQQSSLIDAVHFLDLDKEPINYPDNYFDVIIAGDVLEHLVDPWSVLAQLRDKLRTGGCLLISIPNIREYTALRAIFLRGRFPYASEGIFDKTHVRFFCKKDMVEMISSVKNLSIEKSTPIHLVTAKNSKREIFNKLTFGLFEEFTTVQYLFRVTKTS
jgi:2-polyprenyl-3-methyl-5-hydroxy-6-metoxy-1,4-benzoquinol methylase